MTVEQALKIVEQALNQATVKGAFDLNEVSHIIQALQVLKPLVDKK
jgi:ferric-dicitrate binding protein FerR (iron transport regulator)